MESWKAYTKSLERQIELFSKRWSYSHVSKKKKKRAHWIFFQSFLPDVSKANLGLWPGGILRVYGACPHGGALSTSYSNALRFSGVFESSSPAKSRSVLNLFATRAWRFRAARRARRRSPPTMGIVGMSCCSGSDPDGKARPAAIPSVQLFWLKQTKRISLKRRGC